MPTLLDERIATMEQGYVLEHNGMTLTKNELSKAEWETLGRELVERHETSGWALVDWLLLHRDEWGKRYDHAIQLTGYAYLTLSNMYALGRAFPRDKRISGLSRTYHRCVVSLPEEERRSLLVKAKEHRWTVEQLMATVVRMNRARGNPRKGRTANTPPAKVRCPHCDSVFPVQPHILKEE